VPKSGKRWRHQSVRMIVMNAAYIGKRVHCGEIVADGLWKPILDEETYYACVQILSDPRRRTIKDGKTKYLMGHLISCGVCGSPMEMSGRSDAAKYRCAERYCTSVRQQRLDEHITSVVCERLARPDAADLLGDDTRAEEAKAAMAEAAEKRARLDEFYDAAANGELTAAALARIEARLLPEIETAETRATDLRVPAVLRDVIRPDIADVWPSLHVTAQREVIRTLMTVRLLPVGKSSRRFDPARVEIIWKHEGAAE